MFKKILIANRGEIACRIIKTCKKLDISTVAIYSDFDYESIHIDMADESYLLEGKYLTETYLNIDKIVGIAVQTEAQAIHPGYGFLSENTAFAQTCQDYNIAFIGPSVEQLAQFGLKHIARNLAIQANVPTLNGSSLLLSISQGKKTAQEQASNIGYPVMLKSTAGGGGIGLQQCINDYDLAQKFEMVQRLAKSNFNDAGLYLEKYIQDARHIEVQIFGNGQGEVIILGERDCSIQRRNQKIVEETPATNIDEELRLEMYKAAKRLGQLVKYSSAGTIEFVLDSQKNKFYFLEVNTRLQVEHGITEMVYDMDLVEWMILQASGSFNIQSYNKFDQQRPNGHSIQTRIYAEDPSNQFQPSTGQLTNVTFPKSVRIDTWVQQGTTITSQYDPMIAKVISHGQTRQEAIKKIQTALSELEMYGPQTNQMYLKQILSSQKFQDGGYNTKTIDHLNYQPNTIEVVCPGTQTTVQDFPGRIGYWAAGVPPSGPYDNYSFRLGNKLLNNPPDCAGLEITLSGPTLKFNRAVKVCLTGAYMASKLDNRAFPYYTVVQVEAGQILTIGKLYGDGIRSYLSVEGGIDVPLYLNSRATFSLGQLGGHCGRPLKTGDILRLNQTRQKSDSWVSDFVHVSIRPQLSNTYKLRVLYGPHGAPEFFQQQDIDIIKKFQYKVHYNFDRTGIRLVGPKPKWARETGGEAGLHPSNIHDNAYAIGAINFTGDMPILLGPDGPSLGGFVCPFIIIQADLWIMGQLKVGDLVSFEVVTLSQAKNVQIQQEQILNNLSNEQVDLAQNELQDKNLQGILNQTDKTILYQKQKQGDNPEFVIQCQGDQNILIEYGPIVIDLVFRFRIYNLMIELKRKKLEGVIDLNPGVRSLQIQYDQLQLSVLDLLECVISIENSLQPIKEIEVPSRIIYMPLSWDDESIHRAISKYQQSIRKEAPWCPDNIEFIRRANGLKSVQDVQDIIFSASYLVLGLGDVYLGAPLSLPVNPLHRLNTTKYNPARTWTPLNIVGIGGVYMAMYGIEGPGGYQLIGRTAQIWNTFKTTQEFKEGEPWLFRFFDQIRFYQVSHEELMDIRKKFPLGRYKLRTEYEQFKLKDYLKFLDDNKSKIEQFQKYTQECFQKELQALGDSQDCNQSDHQNKQTTELQQDNSFIDTPIAGNLYKLLVKEKDIVTEASIVAIIESMKTEIQVKSNFNGTITQVLCRESQPIESGGHLFTIQVK